jgi:hypothetical protein
MISVKEQIPVSWFATDANNSPVVVTLTLHKDGTGAELSLVPRTAEHTAEWLAKQNTELMYVPQMLNHFHRSKVQAEKLEALKKLQEANRASRQSDVSVAHSFFTKDPSMLAGEVLELRHAYEAELQSLREQFDSVGKPCPHCKVGDLQVKYLNLARSKGLLPPAETPIVA